MGDQRLSKTTDRGRKSFGLQPNSSINGGTNDSIILGNDNNIRKSTEGFQIAESL